MFQKTPFKNVCLFDLKTKKIKTESIGKLSNFNSQGTKILYQNNLKNIAFFFYIFQGLKM